MRCHRRLAVLLPVVILASGIWIPQATAQSPPLRLLRCDTAGPEAVDAWQQQARLALAVLLNMDDQIAANRHDAAGCSPIPLQAAVLETEVRGSYVRELLEIDARADRRIKVVLTIPEPRPEGRLPAVVCIHGHGGNRDIVYDRTSVYHGFAAELAERGYVTLSTDVGQHTVQDPQRTLMGERLWDLIRVVDLAVSRPEVDPQRVGCGGLSLGGEMAMWLGALDTRIAATVSSGFLTTMENMRKGHCVCWDFPGLQRRYEFADIYSLIGPRPLQCQNGRLEGLPGGFPVDLAEQAMAEIRQAYGALGQAEAAQLAVHDAGHVFDVPAGVAFFDATLKDPGDGAR